MIKYYYEEKTKKELTTKLIDTYEDNGKYYAKIKDSIFYPQGGGQKGDKGYIIIDNIEYQIINTIKDEEYNSILIIDKPIDKKYLNYEVKCYLDWDYRYKQMRLHTTQHIYHYVLEIVNKNSINHPYKAAIEDNFAYIKYNEEDFDIALIEKVNEEFYKLIKLDNKVNTYPSNEDANYRYWECMNYIIPCGGIHVDNLNEIDPIKIEASNKKKTITIKFILD